MSDERYSDTVQQLIDTIGFDATIKLCTTFGGESLYIPKSVVLAMEHDRIREEYRSGKGTYLDLSRKYGRTTRQIRDIIHSPRYNPAVRRRPSAPNTPDLF